MSGTSIRRRQRTRGVVFEARYRDADGTQRSRTFDTLKQARRFLSKVRTQVVDGEYVDRSAGTVPFGDVAEEWFAGTRYLKARTRIGYRSSIDKNLARWYERPIRSITTRDVQRLVDDMVDAGRKPATVRNIVLIARRVFDLARKQRLIRDNPCVDLQLPRLVMDEQLFLTRQQVQHLAATLGPPHDLYVLTAAGTGLRAGELAALRVADLDLARLRVNVRHSLADLTGGVLVLETPKTKAGRRSVPLARPLARLLAARVAGLDRDDYVFGCDGQPLRHNAFYLSTYKPAVRAAGLPADTRFHDLRHTYASLMIAENVHPKRLSVWMGHTSVTITMDRYGHLYDDDVETPAGLDDMYAPVAPADVVPFRAPVGRGAAPPRRPHGSKDL